MCVSVKRVAQTLKEGLAASVHLVTLAMEGVMEMDVQVSIKANTAYNVAPSAANKYIEDD
jgi:hypothetical protein